MKYQYLLSLMVCALFCFSSCKKDKIVVDKEKEYLQVDFKASTGPGTAYDAGWQLKLRPDGVADLIPSGDIAFRGTYKISGSSLKVKTNDGNESFDFIIISDTDIKEVKYGTVLRLKP